MAELAELLYVLYMRYRKLQGSAGPGAVRLGGAVQSHASGDDLLEDLS